MSDFWTQQQQLHQQISAARTNEYSQPSPQTFYTPTVINSPSVGNSFLNNFSTPASQVILPASPALRGFGRYLTPKIPENNDVRNLAIATGRAFQQVVANQKQHSEKIDLAIESLSRHDAEFLKIQAGISRIHDRVDYWGENLKDIGKQICDHLKEINRSISNPIHTTAMEALRQAQKLASLGHLRDAHEWIDYGLNGNGNYPGLRQDPHLNYFKGLLYLEGQSVNLSAAMRCLTLAYSYASRGDLDFVDVEHKLTIGYALLKEPNNSLKWAECLARRFEKQEGYRIAERKDKNIILFDVAKAFVLGGETNKAFDVLFKHADLEISFIYAVITDTTFLRYFDGKSGLSRVGTEWLNKISKAWWEEAIKKFPDFQDQKKLEGFAERFGEAHAEKLNKLLTVVPSVFDFEVSKAALGAYYQCFKSSFNPDISSFRNAISEVINEEAKKYPTPERSFLARHDFSGAIFDSWKGIDLFLLYNDKNALSATLESFRKLVQENPLEVIATNKSLMINFIKEKLGASDSQYILDDIISELTNDSKDDLVAKCLRNVLSSQLDIILKDKQEKLDLSNLDNLLKSVSRIVVETYLVSTVKEKGTVCVRPELTRLMLDHIFSSVSEHKTFNLRGRRVDNSISCRTSDIETREGLASVKGKLMETTFKDPLSIDKFSDVLRAVLNNHIEECWAELGRNYENTLRECQTSLLKEIKESGFEFRLKECTLKKRLQELHDILDSEISPRQLAKAFIEFSDLFDNAKDAKYQTSFTALKVLPILSGTNSWKIPSRLFLNRLNPKKYRSEYSFEKGRSKDLYQHPEPLYFMGSIFRELGINEDIRWSNSSKSQALLYFAATPDIDGTMIYDTRQAKVTISVKTDLQLSFKLLRDMVVLK